MDQRTAAGISLALTHVQLAKRLTSLLCGAALTLAMGVAASAEKEPAATSGLELQRQIVDALAHGRDASALLDRARIEAQKTPPSRGVLLPRNDEAAQLQSHLNAFEVAIKATTARNAEALAGVLNQYEALLAADLLFQERFKTVEATIAKENLSSEIESRRQAAQAAYRSTMSALRELLDPTLGSLLAAKDRSQSLANVAFAAQVTTSIAKARDLLAKHSSHVAAPILRANTLPFRQAKLALRPPKLSPTIQPSYLNPQDSITAAVPSDSASTDDAPLSDEILAKAQSLGYDYIRIYEFVQNEIRTEWYAGGMKGAVGTLRQESGNDVDQASLLIALFRASGLASRYVHGVIELPVDAVAKSLSLTDATQVTNALTRAGVAFTPVIRGGRVAAVNVEQTWVTAQVPYTNYRGAVVDASGKTWLPLAPSLKSYDVVPSARAFVGTGQTAVQTIDTYLAQLQTVSLLSYVRKQVGDSLQGRATPLEYLEQLGSSSIVAKNIGLLPNTLPVAVVAVTEESATLTNAHRQRVRFVVRQGTRDSDPIVLDYTSTLARLASERVTLSYIPATVADQRTSDLFGGLDNVPSYLIKLRPQIKLNGRVQSVAGESVATGSLNRLEIRLISPFGEERVDQIVTAGGYEAIGIYAQQVARRVLEDDPADTEYTAARLLDNVAATYADRWQKGEAELGGLLDVAVVYPWPSVTVVASSFKVDTVLGRAMQLDWQGVTIDAALHVSEPIARDGAAATAKQWMQLSALEGSVLEHQIFQEQFLVDSISADKGLTVALAGGIPLVQVSSANVATVLPTLNHPIEVRNDIENWVRLGFNITVPRDPIAHADWRGSVWRVEDPQSGGAGYFLSGGLAGGATAVGPPGWLLVWMRDAFARANTSEPNPDPLAGESISKISTGDGQLAQVGTELPTRLAVLVRDKKGNPVIGARVVFQIAEGGGRLGGGAELVALTNSIGIADVSLELGQRTDAFPLFTHLNPSDEYSTRVGLNLVDATVITRFGPISIGLPFSAIGVPQDPTRLVRTNPGGGYASPLHWSDSVVVAAQDIYGNPVSNVAVTFAALPMQSTCDPPASNPRNAMVFGGITGINGSEEESCPSNPLLGECGTTSFTKRTSYQGAWAGVIAGSVQGATYRIGVTADEIDGSASELTLEYSTGSSCQTYHGLSYGSVGIINEQGNNIQAAKPGLPYPLPLRISLFYTIPQFTATPEQRTSCNSDGSCTTETVCVTQMLPDVTTRRTTGNVVFEVDNDGSAGPASLVAPGTYATNIVTGPTPGLNRVTFRATGIDQSVRRVDPPGCVPYEEMLHDGEISGSAFPVYGVLPEITALDSLVADRNTTDPTKLFLNENGQSAFPANLLYRATPGEYVSGETHIEFFENGDYFDYVMGSTRSGAGIARVPRGATFDVTKNYEAQVVLNGGELEIRSEKFPLPISQKMFKDVSPDFQVRRDVDLLNQRVCTLGDPFRFTLTQAARVTLTFRLIDNPNATRVVIRDRLYEAGAHTEIITPSDLSPAAYVFELHGVSERDGHEETERGSAISQYVTRDQLAVGHVLVKGVDLFNGHMSVGGQDIKIPGRGVPLEFRRTYSTGAEYAPGVLGARWSHNYESRVVITPCGEAIVIGGEGSGMRFVEDGNGGLRPLKGYHGTLEGNQADRTFDFYSKDGTRYHYKLMGTRSSWDLDFIEDTNHNVTKLIYDPNSPKIAKLLAVEDSANRRLTFTYEDRTFALHPEAHPVIRSVEGPGGLKVLYEYDAPGNLITVQRETPGTSNLTYIERYEYSPISSTTVFSQVLTAYVNPNNARTTYTYGTTNISVTAGTTGTTGTLTFSFPNTHVTEITDGAGGTTRFTFDQSTWRNPTVTDANGRPTVYTLNGYGSPLTIRDPVGTTTMTWSADDVTMLTKRDARGTTTRFEYDDDANVLSEEVGGTFTTTYTYQSFATLPIKNRVRTRTDRNGHTTAYTYDAAGNLLTESNPEGGVTSHTYASNGDRIATRDPRGNSVRMEYDQYGNLFAVTDPLGGKTQTVWSVRSTPVEITDQLLRKTTFTYDALDRVISKTDAINNVRRYSYDSAGNKTEEIDEEGRATQWTYDGENRVLTIRSPINATKTLSYDPVGNKIAETDWKNNTTSYEYDAANRLRVRTEPLGRVTQFSYDQVGNVLTETDALNHATVFVYDALNRRTRRTDARSGVTIYGYDGNGNKTSEQDALNRVVGFTYDRVNRLTRRTEPLGRITQIAYDANGNKTQETDPNGGIRRFTYDVLNRLTRSTDALGFDSNISYDAVGNITTKIDARVMATRFTYDSLNRLLTITDPANAVTTYTYDRVGNRKTERLPNSNVISHNYDGLDRVVSSIDSLGSLGVYEYDANSNPILETDANNNSTSKIYDALNRVTQVNLPENRSVTYNYDLLGNKTAETDARTHRTQFRYDELNRLDLVTDPLNRTVSYSYDVVGNKLTETDKRSRVTSFQYDALNRLTRTTDALNQAVVFTYDLNGNKATETDKRGTQTVYAYDRENRLLTATKDSVTLQTLQYDEVGNKKFDRDALGNIFTYIYDARNLMLTESKPLAAISNYRYDAIGNRIEARDPENRISRYTYDVRRRLITETNAANETTTHSYDGNGNRTAVQRPKNNRWTYAYDSANRISTITDPLLGITRYTYDGNSNRLTSTDANGRTTTNEYDELSRIATMVYPDNARAEFRYDENGNRIGLTDQNGQIFSYTFDALNRETHKNYSVPASPTGNDIQSIVSTYDANGNVARIVESYSGSTGTRTTNKSYDSFDRLTSVTDAFGERVSYQYDANGNRTALIDPDNRVTRYTFDQLNRVATVSNSAGVSNYEYDRSSLPTRTTYPNGTSALTTYDNAKRVASVSNRQGASIVSNYSYTYDTNGNRLTQSEANGGVAESTTYVYDDNDRLIAVAYPDKTTAYTYDAGSNRLSERTTLASSTVEDDKVYAYDSRNQLTSITDNLIAADSISYDYDANGNQILKIKGATATVFVYDVRDQLTAVRENAITLGVFGYDYQGLRVTKDMGGQILRYTYDDDSVLVESDNTGATVAKYDYGATRLLSLTHATEGRQFYLFDALGSVSSLTNNAGNIQARYQYDAFGNFRTQAGSSFNRFGFTGHEKDVETNLYYFKARFYDPDTGRFLSQDPYLGDVNTPPSLHRYLYAYANPTVYIDLNGYYSWSEFGDDSVRAFGGLTGAALGVAMTAVSVAELAYDVTKDSVLSQAGDPAAMLRNYERAQTVAHVVSHPIQTAKAIGAHYSAEFEGANREEAQGNIFTAAIIRGKAAGEITLAIDAGIGLARTGVALTGEAANLVRGARAASSEGAAAGGASAARSVPAEGRIVGESGAGPARPAPAEAASTQRSSSRTASNETTPTQSQASPQVNKVKAEFENSTSAESGMSSERARSLADSYNDAPTAAAKRRVSETLGDEAGQSAIAKELGVNPSELRTGRGSCTFDCTIAQTPNGRTVIAEMKGNNSSLGYRQVQDARGQPIPGQHAQQGTRQNIQGVINDMRAKDPRTARELEKALREGKLDFYEVKTKFEMEAGRAVGVKPTTIRKAKLDK